MDQRKALLAERIRSVRAGFVAALPDKESDIAHHWNTLRHQGWDPAVATGLQRLAHTLAGSGGTFGFPEISSTARALDESLGQTLRLGASGIDRMRPETLLKLNEQVDSLLRVIRESRLQADAAAPVPVMGERVETTAKPVVVIDDDPFLRERMSAVLEAAGYEVVSFETPARAMPWFQEHQPGLVLLDLMFPGRRGPAFDVIADLRGETGQRTPVAVISGHADFRSRMEATRAGADAYLVKPLDEARLLELAAQLTAQRLDDRWRCLVIDDDEPLAQQVAAWLANADLIADWSSSARDSWLKVREFHPDVIVMDINMPECNGIELATMLRQDAETACIPIVFLTADTDQRTRRNAMAAGADDYLLKPVQRHPLVQAVTAQARLGKRLQGRVSRVARQASHGGGLSRHFFFNRLEQEIDAVRDGAVHPALVLIGLKSAPAVLADQGVVGLAALQEQWQERLKDSGETAWALLGDNHVGLLLARDTASGHRQKAAAVLAQLTAAPFRIEEQAVAADACAAILHLRQAQAATAVLKQAEQTLSLALDEAAGTLIDAYVGDAGAVEATGSLPLDRLRMVYQAIATLDDVGDPVNSVQARLADHEGNLLPGGSFLTELEKRGLLPELDAWVFRSAHQVLTDQVHAGQGLTLIVPVSAQSLSNVVYLETVRTLLAESPMRHPRQRLVIAIAESSVITHRTPVERLNTLLRGLGSGLMITGYGGSINAIGILELLQPLYVRLDDALTRRLERKGEYAADDRDVLTAALAQGATVVAGGIDSAGSLSGLWTKGIRCFQGYYIREPETAPALA